MKLLFKQRFFSWFDSYGIYDENENTVFTVKGKLSWGHLLQIYNADGRHIGTVKEKIMTFLPKFEMYIGDEYVGCISKKWSLFTPKFEIDCNGWFINGNFMGWDYTIEDEKGNVICTVSKELFHFTDTYVIDVKDPENALCALMVTLAIDAEKCSAESAST